MAMTILTTLESWERERIPLVLGESRATSKKARLSAIGKLVELDERMMADLEERGISRGGYTIPSALGLARKANKSLLRLLAGWQEERGKIEKEEMALPTSEQRYPLAKIKHRLDVNMLEELEALGMPMWGLQIDTAIQIVTSVCAESTRQN
jgi:hypothetical protein